MTSFVSALLLADTHLGAGQADRLTSKITALLDAADLILHAGDITDPSLLVELAAFAPVHAVLGNNDIGMSLPVRTIVDVGGCSVAMVHDSGAAGGRSTRLRRWFPDADVVVFGHSHIPWNEASIASDHTVQHTVQHHVNPGSAMQRRRQPLCTVGILEVRRGRVADIRIVPV